MTSGFELGAASWGFIYREDLDGAFGQIAECGYRLVEIGASPPHLDLSELRPEARRQIKRELDRHGLRCVAANAIELNPISPNAAIADLAFHQYCAALELAGELGASCVVMITGRRNVFIPMPIEEAKGRLRAQLDRLLPVAQAAGVELALEPAPFGFLETAAEAVAFLDASGFSDLRITLDCANIFFAGADPVEDARAAAGRVALVHISDTWRAKLAHTQVGSAEIDFQAFADVLREIGFDGACVYELVDGEDPTPRLRADWAALSEWGWCA
jgi:L-ribulose-5-phosphate 3-epimerase